jgi:hypothetical protein
MCLVKIGLITAALAVLVSCESTPPVRNSPSKQSAVLVTNRPTVVPPRFRLYHFSPDGISYVVPNNTTDEQLTSLLWLFREKVRSRRFLDIGITQPTSKHFGKKDYVDGVLFVYRGQRCANEQFIDTAGPCGYGEHDDASFQWGFATDAKTALDPNNDDAAVRLADGTMQRVFDYKDGWQPTSSK